MELKLNKLNDKKIRSTGGKVTKMKFSNKANAILFDMFTATMYSNPIGSIVREIGSNCFDSHIEAGNNTPDNPVIITHTYDKVAKQDFISFFDNGVGMSPDRVENIYGVYFESTKRDGNDQIGGFGIGGKTPMAYTDSFSVITRYNGIKYHYVIYKGTESPEIKLDNEISTTECNGTEIRIPVKEIDLDRFQSEIKKQLYYFENIIFQGFDEDEDLNDYHIYKSKDFLYRGNVYGSNVHLCIGKVAYPLNFSNIGLSQYDYQVSIGLQFEIGEIDVTPNREEIRYTDNTINLIKEKLDVVKAELCNMLGKQYNNVVTLKDYYNAKENFGKLQFDNQEELYIGKWIKKSDVNYANFKYNDIPFIPTTSEVIDFFYNVHEYGKSKGYGFNVKFNNDNYNIVYQCKGDFQRKIVKQAYLNYRHDKNFIVLKPYTDLFDDVNSKKYERLLLNFGMIKDDGTGAQFSISYSDVIPKAKAFKLLKAFAKEIQTEIMFDIDSYDDLDIPQDFIDARKQERLSKEILKTTIPLRNGGGHGYKTRISVKNIMNFKGRIFYGDTSEEYIVKDGSEIFTAMFGNDNLDSLRGYQNCFSKGKGIAFVSCAVGNIKYLKMCPNAYHISLLYPILLRRKMINPQNINAAIEFINRYNNLDGLYKGNFGKINTKVVRDRIDIEKEVEELKKYEKYRYVDFSNDLIKKYVDADIRKKDIVIKTEKKLDYLLKVQDKNKDVIRWIDLPYYNNDDVLKFADNNSYDNLVKLLKKVMVFN